MTQVDDLSRSLAAFDQNTSLVMVVEMSEASWLVAGLVPDVDRQPLKKLEPDPSALLRLLERWQAEAMKAGQTIGRVTLAYEAGRDGFWLARWLQARGIEVYIIHSTSVAVSREHRRAKTDRLLDQVAGAVASFTGDSAYDRDRVYAGVAERHPEAAVVVPPRTSAVLSDTAESEPTQRDRPLQHISKHDRMAWQKRSGYNARARAEATMGRWKQVIGDELRAHTDEWQATEVAVVVHALNRTLELGCPGYVCVA